MNMAISWTFYSKKGVPEQPSGLRSPHGPFEAPRQQVWVVEPVSHFAYRWSTHLVLHPRLRSNFIAPQTLAVSRSWLLGEGHFERRSWYDVMRRRTEGAGGWGSAVWRRGRPSAAKKWSRPWPWGSLYHTTSAHKMTGRKAAKRANGLYGLWPEAAAESNHRPSTRAAPLAGGRPPRPRRVRRARTRPSTARKWA